MKHHVRVLGRAERDLAEIRQYLMRESPASAGRLVDRLLDTMATLSDSPERGSRPRDQRLLRLGYRFLVVDPYLIFYKVLGRKVFVYRVLHGHRRYAGLL